MNGKELSAAASRCLDHGIGTLSSAERSGLLQLLAKELRKRTFSLPSGSTEQRLAAFCAHVAAGFAPQSKPLVVFDVLPRLRSNADDLLARGQYLGALVLYCTWINNWLNMVISVARIRRGDAEADVKAYFRSRPRFKDRLGQLGEPLALETLPETERNNVLAAVAARDRVVHYSWEGRAWRSASKRIAEMKHRAATAPALLDQLVAYEARNLDAPYAATVAEFEDHFASA